ncbi:hypothetical protein QBC39DRAFT_265466, partial [Podospora conica]
TNKLFIEEILAGTILIKPETKTLSFKLKGRTVKFSRRGPIYFLGLVLTDYKS